MKKHMKSSCRCNKGEIALFVAIISMFMITAVFSTIPSIDYKNLYITSYSKYLLQENEVEKTKELSLTDFNNYLNSSFSGKTDEELIKFVQENRKVIFPALEDKYNISMGYIFGDDNFSMKINEAQFRITFKMQEDGVSYTIIREAT